MRRVAIKKLYRTLPHKLRCYDLKGKGIESGWRVALSISEDNNESAVKTVGVSADNGLTTSTLSQQLIMTQNKCAAIFIIYFFVLLIKGFFFKSDQCSYLGNARTFENK